MFEMPCIHVNASITRYLVSWKSDFPFSAPSRLVTDVAYELQSDSRVKSELEEGRTQDLLWKEV